MQFKSTLSLRDGPTQPIIIETNPTAVTSIMFQVYQAQWSSTLRVWSYSRDIQPTDQILKKISIPFSLVELFQVKDANQHQHQKVKRQQVAKILIKKLWWLRLMPSRRLPKNYKQKVNLRNMPRRCQDASVWWYTKIPMTLMLTSIKVTSRTTGSWLDHKLQLLPLRLPLKRKLKEALRLFWENTLCDVISHLIFNSIRYEKLYLKEMISKFNSLFFHLLPIIEFM